MQKKNGQFRVQTKETIKRSLRKSKPRFSPQPEEILLRPGEGIVAGVISRECPRRTRKPRLIRLAPGQAVRVLAVKSLDASENSSVSPDKE